MTASQDVRSGVRKVARAARPRAWWIYLLRATIVLTAIAEMAQGDILYGLFCLVALGLVLLPTIVARDAHVRAPAELELAVLLVMTGDMTLGNWIGLYVRVPWYDKALHLSSSTLIGLVGFLAIYVLHATHRVRFGGVHDVIAIFLVTLGIGAAWELAEYAVDQLLGRATQGSPNMSPLDDTMIDLMLDALGGVVAAVLGPIYLRHSKRSRLRVGELIGSMSELRDPS